MKRNIIYMVGALLSSAILTFSCAEDMPTYSGLAVDKNDLFIKIENHTATINVTEGNGNYKVEIADENIVTAKVEGDQIIFTAVKNGRTTATITDWSRHSTVVNIRVKEDFALELDKEEITLINVEGKKTQQIYIASGNDEYKVESSDEEIITAVMNADGTIQVTYVSGGFANVKVTDADGKEAILKVASCDYDLTLEAAPIAWKTGLDKNIKITTGNGGYKVTSDNEGIATVELIENEENPEKCSIKIKGIASGDTKILISDQMGLSQTIAVKVRDGLNIETTSIDNIVIGTPQTINIIDGSGDYSWSASNATMTCSFSEDKTQLIVNGAKSSLNQSLTFTDNIFGESKTINVKYIDYPLEKDVARWFVEGTFGSPAACSIEGTDAVTMKIGAYHESGILGPKLDPPYIYNGYKITFNGTRNASDVEKTNAKLVKLNDKGKDGSAINISNVIMIKVKYDEGREQNGFFWIKFREEGKDYDSYIVAHT